MNELEWSNDQVKSLVEEYKEIPVLWDRTHPRYRDQVSKYEAWCKLAEMFQCEIYDVKKKFNSIFASHRREKSRVRRGIPTSWFLYDSLSFLPHHLDCDEEIVQVVKIKKKRNKETDEEEAEEESEQEKEESEQEFEEGTESPEEIIIKEEPKSPPRQIKYVNPRSRKPTVFKRRLVKQVHVPERRVITRKIFNRPEEYNKKDECESFAEYIAVSLKKHDERTRSMIKQAINNILFEQEMKKYNNMGHLIQNPLGDDCEK